jgi:hypothetical protein
MEKKDLSKPDIVQKIENFSSFLDTELQSRNNEIYSLTEFENVLEGTFNQKHCKIWVKDNEPETFKDSLILKYKDKSISSSQGQSIYNQTRAKIKATFEKSKKENKWPSLIDLTFKYENPDEIKVVYRLIVITQDGLTSRNSSSNCSFPSSANIAGDESAADIAYCAGLNVLPYIQSGQYPYNIQSTQANTNWQISGWEFQCNNGWGCISTPSCYLYYTDPDNNNWTLTSTGYNLYYQNGSELNSERLSVQSFGTSYANSTAQTLVDISGDWNSLLCGDIMQWHTYAFTKANMNFNVDGGGGNGL